MAVRLTKHAREAMEVRSIPLDWVEDAITAPDWRRPDPAFPDRTRSYKAIAAFGNRVLRVVHRPDGPDTVVITVHFDRGAAP